MKIIEDNITLESMKIKIHTIKSQFKCKLKLIWETKKSGASTSDDFNILPLYITILSTRGWMLKSIHSLRLS